MRRQDRTGDRQDADKSIPSLVRVWLLWQEGRPAAVADWWHNKWKSLSVRDHTWTVLIRTISWDTGGRWSVSVSTDIYILTLPDYSASPSHGSRTCRPSLLYSYNMYLYTLHRVTFLVQLTFCFQGEDVIKKLIFRNENYLRQCSLQQLYYALRWMKNKSVFLSKNIQ